MAKRNLHIKEVIMVVVAINLPLIGIAGTLRYQEFIDSVKEQGASEYRATQCDRYTNEDKSQRWLECDVKRVENNQ